MPVTMGTIDKALKIGYMDIVPPQINVKCAAVAQKIEATSKDIDNAMTVKKLVPYGLMGGVGARGENDTTPTAGQPNRENFTSSLKNLYATLEITHKAMVGTKSNAAAFENFLTTAMDGLLESAVFSIGRQYYMDGTGELTACGVAADSTIVPVTSTQFLVEGMIVDILTKASGTPVANGTARRIISVDRAGLTITLEGANVTTTANESLYEQGAKDKELTGFGSVFTSTGSLYGLDKGTYKWMVPQLFPTTGTLTSKALIKAMRLCRDFAGGEIDYLVAAPDAYEEYFEYLETMVKQVNTLDLKGGFKSLSVNGTPLTSDRFIKSGELFGMSSKNWKLHQLSDWDWMEDDKGSILRLIPNSTRYAAVLAKYAELICDHPAANFKMSGITIS